MTGTKLKALPARLESWANCKKRFPAGEVLSPDGRFASMETYCCNPYGGYDTQASPYPHFLSVDMPKGIPAMLRVASLEDKPEAWSMALLREKKEIKLPNRHVTLDGWSELGSRHISDFSRPRCRQSHRHEVRTGRANRCAVFRGFRIRLPRLLPGPEDA